MQGIEQKLTNLFVTKAPVTLPQDFREAIVRYLPWLALLGVLLSALTLFGLIQLLSAASTITNSAQVIANTYGVTPTINSTYLFGIWFGMAILLIEAILLALAYQPLRNRQKKGWNLLFYLSIINFVYALIYLLVDANIGQLLLSWAATIIGAYFLFQVRSFYGVSAATKKATSSKK